MWACIGCVALSAGHGPRVSCQISDQNAAAVTAPPTAPSLPSPPIVANHHPLHHQRPQKMHENGALHDLHIWSTNRTSGQDLDLESGKNRNIRRMPKGGHRANNIICVFLCILFFVSVCSGQIMYKWQGSKKIKQSLKFKVL